MTIIDISCWERGCPCYDPRDGALGVLVQKREWVGLTDEERFLNDCRSPEEIEYAIAIEAKLKEKNT